MNMNSRIYILAIALMTGVGAMAQNTQQNSNVEKIEKYTVQTNLFGDNLFVGANIGAQMYVGDYISKGKAAYSGGYPFSISGDIRSVPS